MNTITKKLFLVCVSIFLSCTLSSCLRQINVASNTYVDSKRIPWGFAKRNSFCVILPQGDTSLLSKEIAFKIESILEDRGYRIADQKTADYCVFFEHGMVGEEDVRTIPVYTPGKIEVTKGYVRGACGDAVVYQEEKQASGTTKYVQEPYVLFIKSLSITVCEAALYRDAGQEEQVWSGSAKSCDELGDFRDVLDYLLTTIFLNFGRDTKKVVHDSFTPFFGNKHVENVRRSYAR